MYSYGAASMHSYSAASKYSYGVVKISGIRTCEYTSNDNKNAQRWGRIEGEDGTKPVPPPIRRCAWCGEALQSVSGSVQISRSSNFHANYQRSSLIRCPQKCANCVCAVAAEAQGTGCIKAV